MKRQRNTYLLIWALTFIVYNVIIFAVLPDSYTIAGAEYSKFGGAFWVGYIGITVALIGNLAVSMLFFSRSENAAKAFLNFPLLKISWGALITTFIAGTIIMAIQAIPNWVGTIICILILFFYAIAVITATSAADAAEAVEEKVKTRTSTMKKLTADAEALISQAPNDEIRTECKQVYEALRYSDPMSSDELADIETRIAANLLDFTDAVRDRKTEEVKAISKALQQQIQNRAVKCRALK